MTFEPVLKKVANIAILFIEIEEISEIDPHHKMRKGLRPLGLKKKMKVIVHQTIMVKINFVFQIKILKHV